MFFFPYSLTLLPVFILNVLARGRYILLYQCGDFISSSGGCRFLAKVLHPDRGPYGKATPVSSLQHTWAVYSS